MPCACSAAALGSVGPVGTARLGTTAALASDGVRSSTPAADSRSRADELEATTGAGCCGGGAAIADGGVVGGGAVAFVGAAAGAGVAAVGGADATAGVAAVGAVVACGVGDRWL